MFFESKILMIVVSVIPNASIQKDVLVRSLPRHRRNGIDPPVIRFRHRSNDSKDPTRLNFVLDAQIFSSSDVLECVSLVGCSSAPLEVEVSAEYWGMHLLSICTGLQNPYDSASAVQTRRDNLVNWHVVEWRGGKFGGIILNCKYTCISEASDEVGAVGNGVKWGGALLSDIEEHALEFAGTSEDLFPALFGLVGPILGEILIQEVYQYRETR
jgi:hypothetical protein